MAGERKLLLKILHIINNNSTEAEVEDLIKSMVALILPTIRKHCGLHLTLGGYQPGDIAMLTVSSLFIRNREGRFPVLERLFNWKLIEKFLSASEPDFRRYLKNILHRRLKQTFYYLSNEIRPERARIKREIAYALKKTPGCQILKNGQKTVVSLRPTDSRPGYDSAITDGHYDRLLELVLNNGFGGLQIPAFIKKLNELLRQQKISVSVPLSHLVELYIDTQKNYLLSRVSSSSRLEVIPESSRLSTKIRRWLEELEEWNLRLLNRYLIKNKINQYEKEAFLRALKDLFQDWQDGGQSTSLFNYLKKYLPELSAEDYRQEKRKIFEYLVKNSKEFLKSRLADEGIINSRRI